MASGSPFDIMNPPASDRSLDVGRVRQVLGEQFPDLPLDWVEYLGSGWEHDVYLIDRTIVFRFPRYADVAKGLDYDKAVHDLVYDSVGAALLVPRITIFGRGGSGFPHRFVGHEVVPGVGAEDLAAPRSIGLGSDLGRALTHIHAISPAAARDVGIRRADGDCEFDLAALRSQVPLVPSFVDIAPGPYEWLQSRIAVPAEYGGPLRFIHNGLHGEHIIVNPRSGRLSGIVDWSSAALGDPAIDFAFLLVLHGKAFLEAALDSYRLALDAAFRDRVTFRARVRALGWLADAIHRGAGTGRSLEQVGFVFAA